MESGPSQDFASIFVTAPDGLRLHLRSYGPRRSARLPVVCLPGFARTAADFHLVATALAADSAGPRRVLALDYRGRGRSEYDRNPDHYTLPVEFADLSAVLTALEIARAVFVGTSRGGLLSDILRRLGSIQFPKLSSDEWRQQAELVWKMQDTRLVPDYDPRLAKSLIDPDRPPPPLWGQFDALRGSPLMVIRGANSDVLASATVGAMLARRAELEVAVVPDQGHAPLLTEPKLIRRIVGFIASCDIAAAS